MAQMNLHTLRLAAGSLTIGGFFLVSVTGVLMFFGWDLGLTSVAHEWFSWLFVAASCAHIAVNIRPFTNYFRFRWSRASIIAFLVILAASFSSWGIPTPHDLRNSVQQALLDAPLSTLASLTHTSSDTLQRRLKAHGITATAQQSLRDLSRAADYDEIRLLMIVFGHD
ncbi:MAG TPA: hypothetical protein PLA43_09225 [Bryobacteraceae bacterium]|nr:hypothetical protein [Bryobacteraceae bacterium]HOL70581.1 hypothetical protein [Bryobacteraceae bacterium]HOQ44862.1 hypothetical protein [Bryobacteraceae bacterium]HPQ16410.1 hypothetical protein [Bryobacteraceae bacterium]HPU72127.1 hypothetical protein [Bryobacteraceae bacterium]